MSDQSLRDILNRVVAATSNAVLAKLQSAEKGIKNVSFQFGPWEEIQLKLIDMTKNDKQRFLKFPLIAILESYPEKAGQRYPELTLQVYIMHHTSKNYDSAKRDAKVFMPILQPIKMEFLRQCALSSSFYGSIASNIQFTEVVNKYIGKEDIYKTSGVPFAEFVDFIHLKDLKLYLNPYIC